MKKYYHGPFFCPICKKFTPHFRTERAPLFARKFDAICDKCRREHTVEIKFVSAAELEKYEEVK